ncbi:glutathione transferase GST 23-like [Miscanthus floridulus]|uniref:glutathione transferase GST 23-like n=1 Tax=Miscanthus floridulus TaxID=154761 RepID=UPI003457CBF3
MNHHLEQQAAESEKKKVKLLGFWASPYVLRVKWALAMKGVEYEYVEEDLQGKSAELLAYNPVHKKVPVLVYHGRPIAESQVILEFIDDAWSHRGDPILPRDPYQRAMARFWARFQQDKLSPPIWRWFTTEGEEQEAAYEAAVEQLLVLEKELAVSGKPFFGGEKVGFVDLSLGPLAYVIPVMDDIVTGGGCGVKMVTGEKMPSLAAWMGRFLSSPAVRGHLPPLEKLRPRYQAMREWFLVSARAKVEQQQQ